MTEAIAISIIAALGALGAAAISVAGSRSRVSRIVAISTVLKDLPVHNEAYEHLAAVRLEDARELRRSQRSTFVFFTGTSLVGLVVSAVLTIYGEQIREWSALVYVAVFLVLLGATLLLLTFCLAVAAGYTTRFVRFLRFQLQERREARPSKVVPAPEND